jgi:hypothetical protein
VLLVAVDSPQLVCLDSDSPQIIIVIFTQHDAEMAGQRLSEEEEEEWAGLVARGANLHHLVEEFRGLPSTQSLHGVESLHSLKLGELMVVTQSLLNGFVWVILRRIGDEVKDSTKALLWQRGRT